MRMIFKKKKNIVFVLLSIFILLITTGCFILKNINLDKNDSLNERKDESVLDKWKAGKGEHRSNKDTKELVTLLLEAAGDNNIEAIKGLFTEDVQNNINFETQIENFLSLYPDDMSGYSMEVKSDRNEYLVDENGEFLLEEFECEVYIKRKDMYYFIILKACSINTENPQNIGLEYLVFQSDEAYVLRRDKEYEEFINIDIPEDENIEVRFVCGNPIAYTYVNRSIDGKDAIEHIKQNNNIDEFKNIYGEPNGNDEFNDTIIYEIESNNSSIRYMELCVAKAGYIHEVIVTETDDIIHYQLWLDENGKIYSEKEFD